MMKIGEALNWAEGMLRNSGIEEAGVESGILIEEELKLGRKDIYLNFHRAVPFNFNSLKNKIIKRAGRIPLAYILGRTQFMGFDFLIDERVMIPRQETEILVESVIATMHHALCTMHGNMVIVDLGTGSGNIAISLAKFIPDSRIYATDISGEALELAKENADRNGIDKKKISFLRGDLLGPLENINIFKKVDLLISNPPYITSADIKDLQKEVHFEPRIALDGGFDGLEFHRRIINDSPLYLKDGGYLFLETGFSQAGEVRNLISKNRNFEESKVIKDYNGIERVVWARLNTVDSH
jgi:release factor glutamine methyltransferase